MPAKVPPFVASAAEYPEVAVGRISTPTSPRRGGTGRESGEDPSARLAGQRREGLAQPSLVAAGLSKSAASQHLKLLREAGLVQVRADATRRLYRADLARVAEVAGFLDDFRATPVAQSKATAETRHRSNLSKGRRR